MKIYKVVRHRIGIDGNGITDLVAMPGCELSCKYCLNKRLLAEGVPKDISEEALLSELLLDACYMIGTDGGVTFGGGEPLLQQEALLRFAVIKPEWMRINIETSLNVPYLMDDLLPYVDEWIIDIKAMESDIYTAYTGGDIERMKTNLLRLDRNKCHIRVPAIPNYKEDVSFDTKMLRSMGFDNIETFRYVTDR